MLKIPTPNIRIGIPEYLGKRNSALTSSIKVNTILLLFFESNPATIALTVPPLVYNALS